MTAKKPAATADTNFCLDLHWGDLLDCLIHLDLPIFLLDVTEREITKQDSAIFLNSDLLPVSATSEEVGAVSALREKYPGPSTPDLITLIVCKKRHWILLTGDAHLRKAAEAEKVSCHGILWFLDQLEEKVPLQRLHDALRKILKAGSYLPISECHKRLAKWKTHS